MKILLVNPPAPRQIEEYDLATWQHLGLGRLSSAAARAGHTVTLVDAKLQRRTLAQLREQLARETYDVVGVTAMTPDIYNAFTFARTVKEVAPRAVTVIGGCHATALPERTMREEAALDYLVFGEGERTFTELLDALGAGAPGGRLAAIPGLAWRDGGTLVKNAVRPWDTRLDELPLPDWQLHEHATHYKLETSRGCPFKCNYCMRVLGDQVRNFPVAQVLDEFRMVMARKPKITMEIVDETFTLNHPRSDELLEGMIALGVGKQVSWFCSTRADRMTAELAAKMKRAGCYMVCFGVESGNQQVLDRMKKNINLAKVEAAVAVCKAAGLQAFVSFILGHPYETLEEITDSINFAAKLDAQVTAIGTMVPYPGTEIAAMVERGEGNYRLLSTDWTQYNRQFSYVLELTNVSKRDLDKLQLIGTLKVYLKNRHLVKLVKFLWQYRREAVNFFRMLVFPPQVKREAPESPSRLPLGAALKLLFQ